MKTWTITGVVILCLLASSLYSLGALAYEPMFFDSKFGVRILVLGTALSVLWLNAAVLAVLYRKAIPVAWVAILIAGIVIPVLHADSSKFYMQNLDYNMKRFEFKLKESYK